MPHSVTLISTIAAGLGLALIMGFIAARLKLPVLVGYLIAGIIIGPATPGFVADIELSSQLAEIGVMLLMFGVGLHFSLEDLLAVRRIALPGAVAQIAVATALGIFVTSLWGWSLAAGIVFGLALSVASTVVLLKALESRGVLDSVNGRIAIGWLLVEDLVMVLVLVLLPALALWLGSTTNAATPSVGDRRLWQTLAADDWPGIGVCGANAGSRPTSLSLVALADCPNRLSRAFYSVHRRRRRRHCLWFRRTLRRLIRARGVFCRDGHERVATELSGG